MNASLARLWCLAFGHVWVEPDDEVQDLPGGGYRGRAYPDRCARCDAERGSGYIAWTVYAGKCTVPGCEREAVSFCDEHRPPRQPKTIVKPPEDVYQP